MLHDKHRDNNNNNNNNNTIVDAANLLMQEVSMAWLVAGVDRGSNVTGI